MYSSFAFMLCCLPCNHIHSQMFTYILFGAFFFGRIFNFSSFNQFRVVLFWWGGNCVYSLCIHIVPYTYYKNTKYLCEHLPFVCHFPLDLTFIETSSSIRKRRWWIPLARFHFIITIHTRHVCFTWHLPNIYIDRAHTLTHTLLRLLTNISWPKKQRTSRIIKEPLDEEVSPKM